MDNYHKGFIKYNSCNNLDQMNILLEAISKYEDNFISYSIYRFPLTDNKLLLYIASEKLRKNKEQYINNIKTIIKHREPLYEQFNSMIQKYETILSTDIIPKPSQYSIINNHYWVGDLDQYIIKYVHPYMLEQLDSDMAIAWNLYIQY